MDVGLAKNLFDSFMRYQTSIGAEFKRMAPMYGFQTLKCNSFGALGVPTITNTSPRWHWTLNNMKTSSIKRNSHTCAKKIKREIFFFVCGINFIPQKFEIANQRIGAKLVYTVTVRHRTNY